MLSNRAVKLLQQVQYGVIDHFERVEMAAELLNGVEFGPIAAKRFVEVLWPEHLVQMFAVVARRGD